MSKEGWEGKIERKEEKEGKKRKEEEGESEWGWGGKGDGAIGGESFEGLWEMGGVCGGTGRGSVGEHGRGIGRRWGMIGEGCEK